MNGMVSYYNPLAMYRHQQQSAQYSPGTAGWYPQASQQYLPPCMGEVEPHAVGSPWSSAETHKYLSHHPAFSSDWPQDSNHFQVSIRCSFFSPLLPVATIFFLGFPTGEKNPTRNSLEPKKAGRLVVPIYPDFTRRPRTISPS